MDSQAGPPRAGIRVGDMKLLIPCFQVAGINGSNTTGPILDPPFEVHIPPIPTFHGPLDWPMLFNLSADIGVRAFFSFLCCYCVACITGAVTLATYQHAFCCFLFHALPLQESVNLAHELPDVVKALTQRLTEVAETMVEPMQWFPPYQGENYSCAKCPLASNLGNPDSPGVPWIK